MFCSRTGRGWARKLKLVWSSFCIFSWDFFPLYCFGPAQKTTSSQIAFRAFTLYELNVCAVYMQACAKWIKNENKNEKDSRKRLLFMVYLKHFLEGTCTIKKCIMCLHVCVWKRAMGERLWFKLHKISSISVMNYFSYCTSASLTTMYVFDVYISVLFEWIIAALSDSMH